MESTDKNKSPIESYRKSSKKVQPYIAVFLGSLFLFFGQFRYWRSHNEWFLVESFIGMILVVLAFSMKRENSKSENK